jgi:hypothetical protein
MTTIRALRPILFLLLAPLAAACPSSNECGTGTVSRDGVCAPLIGPCFGTLREDGTCVLPCAAGEAWDPAREACVPAADCSPGTADQGGVCVGICAADEHWDGTACASGPACGPGTVLDATRRTCVLAPTACEPGTHLEGDGCVPDATECGAGTHLEDGRCVLDRLPAPDVPESAAGPAELTLPAAGGAITLGGNVDAPDADGNPDWDEFVFTAAAGTWLRLSATADGNALPAFAVFSEATDADGYALFERYAINPNGRDCAREVYLPRAGRYLIAVSDYTNVVADLFGYLALPVGGDDYSYQVKVEHLGAPTLSAIVPPAFATGSATNGALHFYRIAAVTLDQAFDIVSAPPGGEPNDLFRAVTVFDPTGAPIRERIASTTSETVRTILAAVTAGDYLVVHDHLVTIGPRLDFKLEVGLLAATNCGVIDCSSGALAQGARALLRWDVSANDLFVGSVALPTGSPGSLRVVFLDRGLGALTASASVSAGSNAKYRQFVAQATRIHALVLNESSANVPTYTVDARTLATPALQLGQLDTGLTVAGMPASTWPPSGFARATAAAGQVVVARALAGTSGPWTTPVEEWLTPDLVTAGPAVDLVTVTWPLTPVRPNLAWSPAGGTLLHRVGDQPGVDVTGATYEVAPYALTPNDLGTLATGATLQATGQTLHAGARGAVLRYTAAASQGATVTVTPAGSLLQSDVWVLVPGALESAGSSTWVPDAAGPHLAGKARATAAAAGAAATAAWTSPYAGPCLVLVEHAGGGSPTDSFTVTIVQTP